MNRCGYISIIGKTNVGKSTLLNSIFDKKVSITSKTSQTTRSNIYAIKNINNSQAIFIDTPGIHSKTNKALNKILRKKPKEVLNDVDLILFIISGSKFDELDEETFKLVKDSAPKKVLLINKIDLLKNKTELFEFVNSFKEKEIFDSIIPISALKKDGIDIFDIAIKNASPVLEVKTRRIGGANYQVPIEVPKNRQFFLASKWIIASAKGRSGKSMSERLATEFISAANNEGGAIKKKEDVHRMAEANRAVAHFR